MLGLRESPVQQWRTSSAPQGKGVTVFLFGQLKSFRRGCNTYAFSVFFFTRNYMKKISSEREKVKTLQMISKGLATLTLRISLLVLLPLMGLYLAGTFS
jgi:hypothetical protein